MNGGRRPIVVSAPVRLDFAGAWTDVAPFALEERGVVVNAAIDLRTTVTLEPDQIEYHLRADDLDDEVRAGTATELQANTRLPLLSALIRRFSLAPCRLRTTASAPPGSGLGTSGALSVALVQAVNVLRDTGWSAPEVAREAWQLETIDAAVPGGQQDQYAAALGGFQELVFDHGRTSVRPIAVNPEFADLLALQIVICHTGRSRFSGDTISRVMADYSAGNSNVRGALRSMVDLAEAMVAALESGDLVRVGTLLRYNWIQQQRLAPGMCTPEMAALETAMRAAGATGGKAAGAGAGGSMFFVVPGDTTAAIAAARANGATVLPTRWATRGVGVD